MEDRFELVSIQKLFSREKICVGTPMESYSTLFTIVVFRDKQTGVLYVSNHDGLTPLIDKDGKPVISFKVSI